MGLEAKDLSYAQKSLVFRCHYLLSGQLLLNLVQFLLPMVSGKLLTNNDVSLFTTN